jgi:hypothetical protein
MESTKLSLRINNGIIDSVSSVHDLRLLLDNELSMKTHISKVASVGYFHLRCLKSVRRILGMQTTASLVTAFVISHLDYCNSVFAGLPKSSIAPLQRVQNAAARLICAVGPRDHVTPSLHELHWLPVELRIIFKHCAVPHLVHTGRGLSYLCDLFALTIDIRHRIWFSTPSCK